MNTIHEKFKTINEIKAWQSKGVVGAFIPDLDIDLYHHPECPGISNSSIGKVANEGTLADLHEYRTRKHEPKDWGDYGNAVHAAILQPELFRDKYTHLPEFFTVEDKENGGTKLVTSNFALKEGKNLASIAEAQGKIILRYSEYQGILKSVENVKKHKNAKAFLIDGEGVVEGSCFWVDESSGMLCKTRPDRLLSYAVVEIKTTESASPRAFKYSVEDYGYHRQGAFQIDGVRAAMGLNPEYFVIVAIEKKPPYKVACYVVNARAIQKGRTEYSESLLKIKEAESTNLWPGYNEDLYALDLPERAYEEKINV